MKQFRDFLFLVSVATIVHHSSHPVYSAFDPDEAPDAPARAQAPTPISDINRKPAVEPRVYIESADSKTGFTYFDYADQTPTQEQRPPSYK